MAKIKEAIPTKGSSGALSTKKTAKGLLPKQPKEYVLKVPQKLPEPKKKSTNSVLPGAGLKKRVSFRVPKDTSKMRTIEPGEAGDMMKIKGTGLSSGKYQISKKKS